MSFLDPLKKIKEVFSGNTKEKYSGMPYKIQTKFSPYRLKARSGDCVELFITIKNMQPEKKLTSVTVKCAGDIGFSETTLKKYEKKTLGVMNPGEEKTVKVMIYGSSVTKKGEYPIAVVVTSHFRDYDHIENAIRKKLVIRAV